MAIQESIQPRSARAVPSRDRNDRERARNELDRASFAVLGYVTPRGEPRSSGVVYRSLNGHLFTAVAADGWKARHIATGSSVSVTVPVRRGGILSLLMPIPPATISFRATAIVHPAGSFDIATISRVLESLLPAERRRSSVLIELVPEGRFVTYGIGVPLMDMRNPELARAVVPVA